MATPAAIEVTPPQGGAARIAGATLGVAIAVLCLLRAAAAYRHLGILFLTEQLLAVALGLGMALVYVLRPFRASAGPRTSLPWYDAVLAAASVAAGIDIAVHYPQMLKRFFRPEPEALAATWIVFLLVIEALRRSAGLALMLTVLAFAGYAPVGHLVAGALQTRAVDVNRMVYYAGLDTRGIPGLVLLIAVTVVVPFVVFGQLPGASGRAQHRNDIALALMGRFRGGAAEIAIAASSLFGSINGIVVSNILATGVVTIPLMTKSGLRPEQAAVEATASNGGQLMPPVREADTLHPGAVIRTGTPEGVAPVQPGSVMTWRLDRIGSMTVRCA